MARDSSPTLSSDEPAPLPEREPLERPAWFLRRGVRVALPLVLLLLALGLRGAYILQTHDQPGFRTFQPGLDLDLHWQAAQELRAGPGEGPRFALMMPSAPLFPAWLAVSQSLLGDATKTPHRYPLALMGAVTVLLVYFLVLGIGGRPVPALIAGLLAACHPATVYFDTRLIKVAPELLLLAGLLGLLLRFGRTDIHTSRRCVIGLALGVGATLSLLLASQVTTVLFGAVSLWFVASHRALPRGPRLLAAGIVVVLFGLTAGLLGQLRWLTGADHPVFVPQAGVHLRVGFHEGGNGTYHRLPGIPGYPFGHTFFARLQAERQARRSLSFSEADAWYRNQALSFVWERPGPTLALVGAKLRLFFNHHEPKGNEYLPELARRTPLLAWLPGSYGLLWVFATWGLMALWAAGRRRLFWLFAGLLGAVLTTNLASFVTWRYRIHVMVPLFVLAGVGLGAAWERGRRLWRAPAGEARLLGMLRWIGPAVLVAVVAFFPLPSALRARMAKTARHNGTIVTQAEGLTRELNQLRRVAVSHGSGALHSAILLRRLERHTEAYRQLRRITARSPRFVTANAMLLEYHAWLGDTAGARRFLARLGPSRRDEAVRLLRPPVRPWVDRILARERPR